MKTSFIGHNTSAKILHRSRRAWRYASAAVLHGWSELLDLIYPVSCVGCGTGQDVLCPNCWAITDSIPQLRSIDDAAGFPFLPLWFVSRYDGAWRKCILAAKHSKYLKMTAFLQASGYRLGYQVGLSLPTSVPLTVVPAPPSWRRHFFGVDVVGILAEAVSCGLVASGVSDDVEVQKAVALRRFRSSQSSKGRRDRLQGRNGAFFLRQEISPGRGIIIVDDVSTTGATVVEMARNLGQNVLAAAVLAGV